MLKFYYVASIKVVINEAKRPVSEHSRTYNSPLSDEVGILMPNDNINNRDTMLLYKYGGLEHISGAMIQCSTHCSFHMVWIADIINLKLQNGKN